MPLFRQSAEDAWGTLRRNRVAGWPSKKEAERFAPIAQPEFRSGFRLEPAHRVFTIGSCFARNIEEALVDAGVDVVTSRYVVPAAEWDGRRNGVLNKYHPPSMHCELGWALDPGSDFPWDHAFLEVSEGRWIDLHLPGQATPVDRERVVARRREMLALYRELKQCDMLILTPGLIEAWWDTEAESYIDRAIPRGLAARYAGRFEHHVLAYQDVHRALDAMVRLVRSHCPRNPHIVFSVSPVPMGATFAPRDVLLANTYSKSVLRAAVEQVVSEHAGVDYFPSYESITLSDRASVFGDDYVHVRDEAVRTNVLRFLRAVGLEVDDRQVMENRRKPRARPPRAVRGMVSRMLDDATLRGWAYSTRSPAPAPVSVDVFLDGRRFATARCDLQRRFARERGRLPSGLCGFSVRLGEELRPGVRISVRECESGEELANSPFVYEP